VQFQSSFGIDVQQMSIALNLATERSLLLIDEFGKGTQPEGNVAASGPLHSDFGIDGAGLVCGILQHLLNRKDKCPKVIASTHFHGICLY
jgi:DNA mismatch repair protein MSH5